MSNESECTLKPGTELSSDGELIGRDPRHMTRQELAALGHSKSSMIKIIRLKCLDCAHTESEVRKCIATQCILWPYRMRRNPFSDRTASPASMEALRRYRDGQQDDE